MSATTTTSAQQTKPSTGKSKFQTLDINNLYCGSRGESSEPSSVKSQLSRKHGMQSLGKVPSARRPPANLPSLRTESGQDSQHQQHQNQNQNQQPQESSSGANEVAAAAAAAVAPNAAAEQAETCAPQTAATSHQHAGAYPGGWAALPPHCTSQFQQEFPSLDGTPPPPHATGPSLRPQTEGSWTAGGSRPGAPDPPVAPGDSRPTSQFNRALVPNFMCKGSTGAGGTGAFPPALISQGPPPGSRQPLARGPQRTRDVPVLDKLVQKPIIREEDLKSMDEIARDTGWAMQEDIDYNQKLNFSDDESNDKESSSGARNKHGSSNANSRSVEKDIHDKRQLQPSIITKTWEDDEVWEMRQRQCSNEVAVAVERAKLRKQQDERRYQEELRQEEAAKQKASSEQSGNVSSAQVTQSTTTSDRERSKEREKSHQKVDVGRESGSKRSNSRDNVRSGNEQSDFRQMTQIGDGRGIREAPKERERDRGKDRDYPRDRDYYRDREGSRIERGSDRDRDSDRGSDRDRNPDKDRGLDRDRTADRDRDRGSDRDRERAIDRDRDRNRDRDNHSRNEREREREMRSERDGSNYYRLMHNSNVPPRFLKKQQGRGGHNYDRMSSSGSDRTEFGRMSHDVPATQDNDKPTRRSEENKAPMPFGQQYDNRWNFSNSKGGSNSGSFHGGTGKRSDDQGAGKGSLRRNRTDSEISSKDGDKVEERRRERHTPDEPRHPRHPPRKLSGSSDGRHPSNRDCSDKDDDAYRWEKEHDRRSSGNYEDKKNADYNDHGSKEGSYDWRAADKEYTGKPGRNYGGPREVDRQNSRESQKEYDNRKNESDRKSSDNYDKSSADKLSEAFEKKCNTQDKKEQMEIFERKSAEKNEPRDEKVDSNKLVEGEYEKDYKQSVDDKDTKSKLIDNTDKIHSYAEKELKEGKNDVEEKRGNQAQLKKNIPIKKMDDHSKIDNENIKDNGISTKVNYEEKLKESIPEMVSSENTKSQIVLNVNKLEEKPLDHSKIELQKDQEFGKEKLERKLSSSGSEKKINAGGRNRTDSTGKKGYGGVVYRGTNWGARSGDSRRRGGGGGRSSQQRSNRDPVYSESEISGDEVNQQHNVGGRKSGRSPKSNTKKNEKDEKNRNAGKESGNQSGQVDNRFPPKENQGPNNNPKNENRIEGREAFAPRGEPSRRGRGGYRGGRGSVHVVGYGPHSTKSPFGQSNAAPSNENEIDPSKGDNLDDKGRSKQQVSNAGIIGRERERCVPPRLKDKKYKKGDGVSGEEEAWETTSEHSESGKQKLLNRQYQKNGGPSDKKQGPQGRGQNSANRQNSSGNIGRNNQPNKKDIPPFGSVPMINRADDDSHQDGKVSKSNKDKKEGDIEVADDGFQEVRNKKNVKDTRSTKEDLPQARIHKHQGKNADGQRNNSSTRNSSEKSGSGMRANSGSMNSMKMNGPPNLLSGQPQNSGKSLQFDRLRQNNLPPRLVRQMENIRNQKQQTIGQGFNPNSQILEMNSMPLHVSAWDKPIGQPIRENEQALANPNLTAIDCNDSCLTENHSGHSSQRSTPNDAASIDQKSTGGLVNLDKSGLLDGTTTPVQTIIFENTNYKSAPDVKQKYISPNIGQQSNANNASMKLQPCSNAAKTVGHQQNTAELDNQILGFSNESQSNAPFIADLINADNSQPSKRDASPIQLPMSFGGKTAEDSSDMKLDFAFDPELSQLTEDKTTKNLGLPRSMHGISSSQNTMSLSTDRELNLKIASVKKVWDNTSMPTVIEHPTSTDESSHSQHNLSSHNMAVSSPHNLSSQHQLMTSQHNLTSQHNHSLSQQLTSPHGIAQHNLVSQHNMSVNSTASQFGTGFDDHQSIGDGGQSQGFSPSGTNVNNQTTNVCKVKPTQQALHSAPGITQSALQSMQASLLNQQGLSQAASALQSMGSIGGVPVGGVMGLSPPPMQHTYNHINYQPSQYGGISAIPSPPTVLFNSSQQLLNSSQQIPSQSGLYGPFQIDQSRNQYGGFAGAPYAAGSAQYSYQPPDMFQSLGPSQYRMQDIFQAAGGAAAFGQSGQLGTNPSTVLISSSSNSLMSASVKPSNQPIGAIGTKGTSYQTQQYLGYGAPHEGPAPPPYAAAMPPPSIVRSAPQAPPPSLPPPQPASSYYSQNAGGQTGFYPQTANVSTYGIQFGQPNQNHNSASLQNFGSQVLSSQFQMAAAIQQQYNRAAQHQPAYVGTGNASTGKQDHNPHLSRPQQLKSPLQDHPNVIFGGGNIGAQIVGNQGNVNFGGGAPSPKNGTPNSNNKGLGGSGFVGGPAGAQQQNLNNKPGSQQQHSPPHHKYQSQPPPPPQQQYQPLHQVIQSNGRQASLNMAISRTAMQRYPTPIQRPIQPQNQLYNNNRNNNNRHQPTNGPPHNRHNNGGNNYYQSNATRNNPPTVPTPPAVEPPKPAATPSAEELCPQASTAAVVSNETSTSTSVNTSTTTTTNATVTAATAEASPDKKTE